MQLVALRVIPTSVVPLIFSGLHCGTRPVATDQHDGWVVPLIFSGLHCGVYDQAREKYADKSSR